MEMPELRWTKRDVGLCSNMNRTDARGLSTAEWTTDSDHPEAPRDAQSGCGSGRASLRARLVAGVVLGLISGTFFALLIAVVCVILWLTAPGGLTGAQVAQSGLVFIGCAYVVALVRGIWTGLQGRYGSRSEPEQDA